MAEDAQPDVARGVGIYFAVLQHVFTLGWDQAIFTIADTAMGMVADKLAPWVGRLGIFGGGLTALSCAAFVALPFVAGTGPSAQVWFILIVIWAVTSSALRAPPLTLIGRHAARDS